MWVGKWGTSAEGGTFTENLDSGSKGLTISKLRILFKRVRTTKCYYTFCKWCTNTKCFIFCKRCASTVNHFWFIPVPIKSSKWLTRSSKNGARSKNYSIRKVKNEIKWLSRREFHTRGKRWSCTKCLKWILRKVDVCTTRNIYRSSKILYFTVWRTCTINLSIIIRISELYIINCITRRYRIKISINYTTWKIIWRWIGRYNCYSTIS